MSDTHDMVDLGCFEAHGLVFGTNLPFPECLRSEVNDIDVSIGPVVTAEIDDVQPPGRLLADFWSGTPNRCWLTESEGSLVVRVPSKVEFVIAPDLGSVEVRRSPNIGDELIAIMSVGFLSAVLITLGGELALHASAVETDGQVVLIAGPTGHGKSTTASLLVSAGALGFADDVIRVSPGETITVHRGVPEYRLRPSAAWIDGSMDGMPSRETVDGRRAVAAAVSDLREAPPSLIVFPRPARGAERVEVVELDEMIAFAELHRCLRLEGWIQSEIRSREFELVADVAHRIPSVLVKIPWQVDHDAEIGSELRQVLDRRARSEKRSASDDGQAASASSATS